MSKQNDISFDDIAKDILNGKKFNILDKEVHHGITRYSHIMRVSKATYNITKKLKMDYVSATRAALLHDYYTENDLSDVEGLYNRWKDHPEIAYNNAKEEFDLNDKEKNMIESHMFPMGNVMPKYKESWTLSLIDKGISTYEQYKNNWKPIIGVYIIFVINMIMFGQK